jgi:phosphoribosylformylglycinamidine cyclo-ligase
VLPDTVAARIDLQSFTAPPVFGWLAQAGRLDDTEMLKTFNCGIGMVVVAAKSEADAVLAALRDSGETPAVIGAVTAPGGAKSDAKGKGDAWAVAYAGTLRDA